MQRNQRHVVADLKGGHVFRQLEMNRPGPLFRGQPERFTHHGRDTGPADDLPGRLGQRLHRCNDIDDLEARLVRRHDGFLPGNEHHRHGAKMGVRGAGDQIQRARAERCHADTRSSRQSTVGCRHESGRLFMARHDELNAGAPQRLDYVEIFFTRHGKNAFDAFILQSLDEKVRRFHGSLPCSFGPQRVVARTDGRARLSPSRRESAACLLASERIEVRSGARPLCNAFGGFRYENF